MNKRTAIAALGVILFFGHVALAVDPKPGFYTYNSDGKPVRIYQGDDGQLHQEILPGATTAEQAEAFKKTSREFALRMLAEGNIPKENVRPANQFINRSSEAAFRSIITQGVVPSSAAESKPGLYTRTNDGRPVRIFQGDDGKMHGEILEGATTAELEARFEQVSREFAQRMVAEGHLPKENVRPANPFMNRTTEEAFRSVVMGGALPSAAAEYKPGFYTYNSDGKPVRIYQGDDGQLHQEILPGATTAEQAEAFKKTSREFALRMLAEGNIPKENVRPANQFINRSSEAAFRSIITQGVVPSSAAESKPGLYTRTNDGRPVRIFQGDDGKMHGEILEGATTAELEARFEQVSREFAQRMVAEGHLPKENVRPANPFMNRTTEEAFRSVVMGGALPSAAAEYKPGFYTHNKEGKPVRIYQGDDGQLHQEILPGATTAEQAEAFKKTSREFALRMLAEGNIPKENVRPANQFINRSSEAAFRSIITQGVVPSSAAESKPGLYTRTDDGRPVRIFQGNDGKMHGEILEGATTAELEARFEQVSREFAQRMVAEGHLPKENVRAGNHMVNRPSRVVRCSSYLAGLVKRIFRRDGV